MTNLIQDDTQIAHFCEMGTGYEEFLYLAAQPLLFSTDLLYKLWLNFRAYKHKTPQKQASYIVVSDLILSGICQSVGADLFCIEEEKRKRLSALLDPSIRKKVAFFIEQYAFQNKAKIGENIYNIHALWAKSVYDSQEMERIIIEKIKKESNEYQKVNYLSLYFKTISTDSKGLEKANISLEFTEDVNDPHILKYIPKELEEKIRNWEFLETELSKEEDKKLNIKIPNQQNFKKNIGTNELQRIDWLKKGLEIAKSVCKVHASDGHLGTGFLVGGSYLYTANCVLGSASIAQYSRVEFGYDDSNTESVFYDLDYTNFITSKTLDYTRVKVKDNVLKPLSEWKSLEINSQLPNKKDGLVIIQHPEGRTKEIAFSDGESSIWEHRLHYKATTRPGAAGAPVFDINWNVIALHHAGGNMQINAQGEEDYVREGILFSYILEDLQKKIKEKNSYKEPVFYEKEKITKPIKIMLVYNSKDADYANELTSHLFVHIRNGNIKIYDIHKNINSEKFTQEVLDAKLEESNIILILISNNLYRKETRKIALKIEDYAYKKRVIPIKISSFNLNNTIFEKLPFLPLGNKNVSEYENRDAITYEISRHISKLINRILDKDLDKYNEQTKDNNSKTNLHNQSKNVSSKVEIFILFDEHDTKHFHELRQHLILLEKEQPIRIQSITNLPTHFNYKDFINRNIKNADIVLLLISADFLVSDGYNEHLTLALELKKTIVPILLRYCILEDYPIAKLSLLPSNKIPITAWDSEDRAYFEVVRGIEAIVKVKISNKLQEKSIDYYQDARNLVSQGKLNKAIDYMLKLIQQDNDTESIAELRLLSGRYKKNERNQNMGVLTNTEYNAEYNKIAMSLLSLLGTMEEEKKKVQTNNNHNSNGIEGVSGIEENIGGRFSSESSKEYSPLNILFMAAQPDDQFRLQSEFDKIRQKVQSTIKQHVLHFYLPTWDTDYDKLLTRLQEDKPNVLHYSGYGTMEGMGLINNIDRSTQLIENYELEDIFEGRGKYLQLVFLNSCFSSTQAKVISEQGMYVLGINNQEIANEFAISLAERFYLGFTTQDPPINLKKAIRRGCTNFAKSYPAYADFISLWKDGQEINYRTFTPKTIIDPNTISQMGYTWLYPPQKDILPLMLLERVEVGILKQMKNTFIGVSESAENIHADIFSLFPKPSGRDNFPRVSTSQNIADFKEQVVLNNNADYNISLFKEILSNIKTIDNQLKKAKKLTYGFKNPTRRNIESVILLGEYLNLSEPSSHAHSFIEKLQAGKLFVITEVLQANAFTVRDASSLIVEEKVDNNSSAVLNYKADEPMTFALQALKILYDKKTNRYSLSKTTLKKVR